MLAVAWIAAMLAMGGLLVGAGSPAAQLRANLAATSESSAEESSHGEESTEAAAEGRTRAAARPARRRAARQPLRPQRVCTAGRMASVALLEFCIPRRGPPLPRRA